MTKRWPKGTGHAKDHFREREREPARKLVY